VLHDDVRGRIGDMVAAISKIRTYVKGHDSASFAADGKARDAVVWNLAVLGEAARAIPDAQVDAHSHRLGTSGSWVFAVNCARKPSITLAMGIAGVSEGSWLGSGHPRPRRVDSASRRS
jgi:hypothetical protein